MLKKGDKAPEATLIDDNGRSIKLSKILADKTSVIFFYPKDFSLGCTKEVCLFRDHHQDFKQASTQVLGISSDDPDSHRSFKLKHNLNYPLFTDPEGGAATAFGIKKTWGVLSGRATFIFDRFGICQRAFSSQINIFKHIDEALKAIRETTKLPNSYC